jgi:hypoxanthine phosphoribosyltransferase
MMHDDIERVLFTQEELQEKVAAMGKKISEDYQNASEDVFCVGILKGAVVFYTDLVRSISLPVQFDFMIASSYGNETSTSGSVKLLKDLDYDVEGKHLILIEDIIDSGTTMQYLMRILRERRPKSIKLCALLSKPSRRTADVHIDYLGAEVPDEFLVGYGLDYAGAYRNLPYIGILKPAVYA